MIDVMTKTNRSIERGLAVLQLLAENGSSSLAALAAQTGLPKATLLRICATLEAQRWITKRSSDGCYKLGSGFPTLGGKPDLLDHLVGSAKAEILALSEATGLGSDLAGTIGRGRVEIVDTTRAFKAHEIYPECVGFRPSPFRSALGAAFLCGYAQQERAALVSELSARLSQNDQPSLERLTTIFSDFDAKGYTRREHGHWGRAVDYGALPNAIAVPLLRDGAPVGAVSLVWAAKREPIATVVKQHLPKLIATATAISRNL